MPFVPCISRRDGKQPVNYFVELADDGNDKNDDFINFNILQKWSSSVKPMLSVNRSVNERGRGFYNLRLTKDKEGNGSIIQDDHGFYPEMFASDQKKNGHDLSCSWIEWTNTIGNNFLANRPSFNRIGSELANNMEPRRLIKEDSLFKTRSKQIPSGFTLFKKEDSVKQPIIKASDNSKDIEEKKISKPNKVINSNDEVEQIIDDSDDNVVNPPELKLKKQRSSKCSIPKNVNIRRHRK